MREIHTGSDLPDRGARPSARPAAASVTDSDDVLLHVPRRHSGTPDHDLLRTVRPSSSDDAARDSATDSAHAPPGALPHKPPIVLNAHMQPRRVVEVPFKLVVLQKSIALKSVRRACDGLRTMHGKRRLRATGSRAQFCSSASPGALILHFRLLQQTAAVKEAAEAADDDDLPRAARAATAKQNLLSTASRAQVQKLCSRAYLQRKQVQLSSAMLSSV